MTDYERPVYDPTTPTTTSTEVPAPPIATTPLTPPRHPRERQAAPQSRPLAGGRPGSWP